MYKSAATVALLLFAPALCLTVQPGARAQGEARALPAPTKYLLGPDDVISIQVIDFPELCVPQVTVPPDGKITVPLLGGLPVAGKTTEQIAQTLTRRWTEYVNDPSVTVTLTQRRKQSVQFYGHVAHAGPVEYKPDLHLMQALAQAGGVAVDGDASQVTVTHGDGRKETVNVTDAETAAGTDQDVALAPDDVIYVPARHVQVSILGEVVKPGAYDYTDKMTVLDALKDAGNPNPETADLPDATLQHDGHESRLDLDALLIKGQTAGDIALAPGDRIFVPTLHNRIYVDGAVNKPGYYAFKPGDRILDAINGSGGTEAGISDLAKVSVVRLDKMHDVATQRVVNVAKYYRTADMESNPVLAPGDAVYVPVKGARTDPISVLGSIIGIGTGTRVLTRP